VYPKYIESFEIKAIADFSIEVGLKLKIRA
jgi:hypothetical protein